MAINKLTILLLIAFLLLSCDSGSTSATEGPLSTETSSTKFIDIQSKQQYLERYIRFRRSYKKLDFYISYHNNSGRMLSGPSDWGITIVAVVPENEIEFWIAGLKKTERPKKLNWIHSISKNVRLNQLIEWYKSEYVILGIDRKTNTVVYNNSTSRF